jgi:hypothetical protein
MKNLQPVLTNVFFWVMTVIHVNPTMNFKTNRQEIVKNKSLDPNRRSPHVIGAPAGGK